MALNDATDLAEALSADGDFDVTVDGDDLLVRGRPFARVTANGLAVHLPPARSADLLARGMAEAAEPSGWVLAPDHENWHELASEARDFVGEPPVGRDS